MTTFELVSLTAPKPLPSSKTENSTPFERVLYTQATVRYHLEGSEEPKIQTFSFRLVSEYDRKPLALTQAQLALCRLTVTNPTPNPPDNPKYLDLSYCDVRSKLGKLYRENIDRVPFSKSGNSRRVYSSVSQLMKHEGICVEDSEGVGMGSYSSVVTAKLEGQQILIKRLKHPEKMTEKPEGEKVGFWAPESAAPRVHGMIVGAQGHFVFAKDPFLLEALRKDHGPANIHAVLLSNVGTPLNRQYKQVFEEKRVYETTAEFFKALGRLHETGIVHNDLKLNNLAMDPEDPEKTVKIFDFGLAVRSKTPYPSKVRRLYFLAPEYNESKGHDHQADIWSSGILIMEGFFHSLFFSADEKSRNRTRDFLRLTVYKNPSQWSSEKRMVAIKTFLREVASGQPSVSESTTENMITIISSCLRWDPKKRPTARSAQALTSTFLTSQAATTPTSS